MCGILGIHQQRPIDLARFRAAVETMHHRGPDDGGVWSSERCATALGHRRLSILDLSAAGFARPWDARQLNHVGR